MCGMHQHPTRHCDKVVSYAHGMEIMNGQLQPLQLETWESYSRLYSSMALRQTRLMRLG